MLSKKFNLMFGHLNKPFIINNYIRNYSNQKINRILPQKLLKNPLQTTSLESEETLNSINKSIVAYLENAQRHKDFMKAKRDEFELGKRHLANIMGWDPENITQDDINKSIEYLFPSGLFEKLARPVMFPPDIIYPKFKEAQYGLDGRPYHTFFYTKKPNYYQALYDLYEKWNELNAHEDLMISKNVLVAPPESKFEFYKYEWMSIKQLKQLFLEKLSDNEYNHLIQNLERLVNHPYSSKASDFLKKFTQEKISIKSNLSIDPLTYDEEGRAYSIGLGRRKQTDAKVTVWGNGTGKIIINQKYNLQYFKEISQREQILLPLKVTGMMDKVDIEVEIDSEKGISSQAGAIRHGLSLALKSFISEEQLEQLRITGLVTKDRRVRERKKPGLYRARKRHPHKSR